MTVEKRLEVLDDDAPAKPEVPTPPPPANPKQAALAQIQEKVQIAMNSLLEAQQIADANNVMFTFSPSYGMGGTYYPVHSGEPPEDGWDTSTEGWMSSSNNC